MTKVKIKVKQHPAVRGLKMGMPEFCLHPHLRQLYCLLNFQKYALK